MTKKRAEVTTNDLFDYMQQGFADISGRLDNHESRFDKLEGRFDKLEGRFDKLEGRFDKLEKYTISGFDRVEKALETKASAEDVRRIMNILDRIEKQQEITEDERRVMSFQLTRLHDWVEKAAKRLDIEFIK